MPSGRFYRFFPGRFFSRKLPALVLFALIALPSPAGKLYGDSVRLTSGRVLRGKILNQNRKYIVLRTGSRIRRISKKNIDTIKYVRPRTKQNKAVARPEQPADPGKKTRPNSTSAARANERPAPGPTSEPKKIMRRSIWAAFPQALVPGWTRYENGQTTRAGVLAGAHLALAVFSLRANSGRLTAQSQLNSLENTALTSLGIPSQAIALNIYTRLRADEYRSRVRSRSAQLNASALLFLVLYAYNVWDAVTLSAQSAAEPGIGFMGERIRHGGEYDSALRFAYRVSL